MQVKKFEARNMKEALELVKNSLGPDAIIVAARDMQKGYGLGGEGSVEVTAAVSDYALKKREFVEKRLTPRDRDRLTSSSARVQKEFMTTVMENRMPIKGKSKISFFNDNEASAPKRSITRTRYVDIDDEEPIPSGRPVTEMLAEIERINTDKLRAQALRLNEIHRTQSAQQQQQQQQHMRTTHHEGTQLASAQNEVHVLRNEIAALKQVIDDFQKLPQRFVSVHPGAELGLPYELSFIYEKLREMGLNQLTMNEVLTEAQRQIPFLQLKKKSLVEAWVVKYIMNLILELEDPFHGTVHAFMGPSGHGKTSTLVKMASHLLIEKRRRVGIITTDTYKIGASDQMKIYSQILNVPFAAVRHPAEWNAVMSQLGDVDHVLIDMPGLRLGTQQEVQSLLRIQPPAQIAPRKHLVLSAAVKDAENQEAIKKYGALGFNDLIFTCIDQTIQHGVMFNLQKFAQSPIHSFGIGPHVPEDWEAATRERLIDLMFKLSKK